MNEIHYIDRKTKRLETENIYGKSYIEFLYGETILSALLRPLFCRVSFFSKLYGKIQKSRFSKKKIQPFIEAFHIDTTEFRDSVDSFPSFDAFFTRHLQPSTRPITKGNERAILPADGRFLVFPDMAHHGGYYVKGKYFSLEKLLNDKALAHKYGQGSMMIGRLAPVDYHRFHFPCNCTPSSSKCINGNLYSVNPIALRKHIEILTENKRVITQLRTENFGTILYIEVGATHVGSIHQTFEPGTSYTKGDEKGYFSFGGSCLILLFEPFRIQFDQDLIEASKNGYEMYAHMGESLGRALS